MCGNPESRRNGFGPWCQGHGDEASSYKAVTFGGAVISKAGTMTGGVTNEDSNRAGRWDDKKVLDMRDKKEKIEAERANLDKDQGVAGCQSVGGIEELRNNYNFLTIVPTIPKVTWTLRVDSSMKRKCC
jgi:hypothetical protein